MIKDLGRAYLHSEMKYWGENSYAWKFVSDIKGYEEKDSPSIIFSNRAFDSYYQYMMTRATKLDSTIHWNRER